MNKSVWVYFFLCLPVLCKMWEGQFAFQLFLCVAGGMFLFDFFHREAASGHFRQNPECLPGHFLEKLPLSSNPRPNTIQSVRKRQRGMRCIRSQPLCPGALPFHTGQHCMPAHTKQSVSHTFPTLYLLHLWDPYPSTLPTHISHSPYVCVSRHSTAWTWEGTSLLGCSGQGNTGCCAETPPSGPSGQEPHPVPRRR